MNLVCTRGERYEYEDRTTGRLYFSVSQILSTLDPDAFKDVTYEALEGAQYRGRRVHMLFSRVLAWKAGIYQTKPTTEAPFQGYLDSILATVEEEDLYPIAVEQPGAHASWPYAGTCDGLVEWRKKQTILLVDLKTGLARRRAHRVQVQLYQKFPTNATAKKLGTLYALPDGTPAKLEIVPPSPEDWAWAMNGLFVLIGRTYG